MTADRPAWLDAGQMSPLDDKLGIRITDFDPDHVVATMPVEGNQQPFGLLHGGATCSWSRPSAPGPRRWARGPAGRPSGSSST